jgi:ABC-type multidrug transport system fused ATPase/permease subunit
VDGSLAQLWFALLMVSVLAGSRIIAIVASSPLFLFPSLIIGLVGGLVGRIYTVTQLSVQRLRSNAKAPVVAAINDTFAGLATIRAFGAQEVFKRQCTDTINRYSQISMTSQDLNRWIAVRMQVRPEAKSYEPTSDDSDRPSAVCSLADSRSICYMAPEVLARQLRPSDSSS